MMGARLIQTYGVRRAYFSFFISRPFGEKKKEKKRTNIIVILYEKEKEKR